jgi:hypothetical protein
MDFYIDTVITTSSGVALTVVVWFPESWALDTSMDSAAQLYLSLWLQGSTDTGTATLGFTTNSVQAGALAAIGPTWREIIRYWDGTLPTGGTEVEISLSDLSGGPEITIQRAFGSGPDSGYYFTF